MRTRWLDSRGPYPCNIGFCPSLKAFTKTWREVTDDALPEPYCNPNGARLWQIEKPKDDLVPVYLFCIEPGATGWAEVAGMIAHEATHLVQWLWEQIGEDEPGKEAEAYLVQSLVREILNIIGMPERVPNTEDDA